MSNRSFIFLCFSSLLLGLAWLASAWAGAGFGQARNALQQVERAEQELKLLKGQLARWETLASASPGRVEPVALDAKFLPSELSNSSLLLAGLYADHGYFNLRRFVFAWGQAGGEGSGSMASMRVEGEKLFVGQQPPPAVAPDLRTHDAQLPAETGAGDRP